MPRFYSPEWVAAFNEAVGDLDAGSVDTGASLAAAGGRFRVSQVVRDAPAGQLLVTLVVEDGRVSLELGQPTRAPADDEPAGDPNVTVSLSYEDAVAMSQGRLDPAEAIGRGRVRVRGDLAVLVAGQAILGAAAERLAALQAGTTY